MNVVVSIENRFARTPDGRLWTRAQFPYPFWRRYLEVFDGVRIVARVEAVEAPPEPGLRAGGEGVSVHALPYYVGPRDYLRVARRTREATRTCFGPDDAVILRAPSHLANVTEPHLRRAGHPYALEVVSDPHMVFSPGAVRHPARPFFRWWFARRLRAQCRHAEAVAYVTQGTLQASYPPGPDTYAIGCSDVELGEAAFAAPRVYHPAAGPRRVIMVGGFDVLYKAQDVLIEAMARLAERGADLRLTLVGEGRLRAQLKAQVARLGLGERVAFTGGLPGAAAVRDALDAADLFVLPSRTEGLPRALVEAMARGLPCLGTTVGGIPELLAPSELVPPNDPAALADALAALAQDPARLTALSRKNIEVARAYHEDALRSTRRAFFEAVRDRTLAHQRGRPDRVAPV